MKLSIVSYGCASAAGDGVAPFWQALVNGKDQGNEAVCRWDGVEGAKDLLEGKREGPFSEVLLSKLGLAYSEAIHPLENTNPWKEDLGVILASTKGCLEDFIWEGEGGEGERDPLVPVLEKFVSRAGLQPKRSLCISNACSSSHAALFLGAHWLEAGVVSNVLILGCDMIGSFIYKGFRSLRALTGSRVRCFSGERDGLQLGDAAAALILSKQGNAPLQLNGIGLDVEGYAVTRPAPSGSSLIRAYRQISEKLRPDFIVAHGTGTQPNDAVEDQVFGELFGQGKDAPPVTATKWCIGHTLGASGLMDCIAACESLVQQKPFRLANTMHIESGFGANYWHRGKPLDNFTRPPHRALVTSLGFGGIHACALIGKGEGV